MKYATRYYSRAVSFGYWDLFVLIHGGMARCFSRPVLVSNGLKLLYTDVSIRERTSVLTDEIGRRLAPLSS